MANLPEDAGWVPGIYQLEDTDNMDGGVPDLVNIPGDGIDNVPLAQLAARTVYLKDRLMGLGATAETVADLNAPVGGEITQRNGAIEDHLEILSDDPWNKGWMVRIKASDLSLEGLMDAAAYEEHVSAS